MKGIINLYKPRGITSSNAVVECRKILGVKTIGHMGTLDPAGEGVLLLGVGKATRLFDFYLHKDKVYDAEFDFGYETDTLDGDGIIAQKTDNLPNMRDILSVLPDFMGKQLQVPPQYSAKSVGGVRAYKYAREGKEISLPACEIEIFNIELLNQTKANTYMFRIHCSSGTYIRSICRDMAKRLNTLATMVSIKRIRCGNFSSGNSITLDELRQRKESALISVEKAIEQLPSIELPENNYSDLINGIKIKYAKNTQTPFALYCKKELFGIADIINGIIKIKTYLRD